ncbi:MAG: FtsX-like permease family protein [Candidatus Limnocylindria bacterium]
MRLASIAWRGLTARPLRSALAAVGVALGVAVVTATIVASEAADEAVRSATTELLGRADLRVRAFDDAGFTPRAVQAARSLPGVEAGAPVSERRLQAFTDPGENEQVFTLLVLGIDPEQDRAIRELQVVAGVGLSSDSPTDALVPAAWAAEHRLRLGDRIRLNGRIETLPPLRIVGLLDRGGFAALNQGAVLVMGREALNASFAAPSPIRHIDLDVTPGREAEVRSGLDTTLDEPFVVETAADTEARLSRAQASFGAVAFLFGLVAVVVGAFLVGNTLAMTVGERTRELGLLRAAGTTSRQVLGLVLRQGMALALAGSFIGVALGVILAAAMIGFLQSTRAVLVEGLPLPPLGLLLAFGLGIGVTLAGALVPAVRAARLSPLEALRPSPHRERELGARLRSLIAVELLVVALGVLLYPLDRADTPLLPLLLSLGLLVGGAVAAAIVLEPLGSVVGRPFEWFFGAQGLLGRVNLSRDRARTGLTVGALMIALSAVVALGTVAESARAGAQRWVASILPGGHAVRLSVPVDVDSFRGSFDQTAGLKVASPVVEQPVVIRDGERQREASLAGIDPNVFQDHGALLMVGAERADALAALRAGGAVLVPESLALRERIAVGDSVSLAQPGSEPVEYRVAGLLQYTLPSRTPDGALMVSLADARDAFGATNAALWVMVPQPEIAPSVFAASVRETAASLAGEAVTAEQLSGELSRSLDRLIGLFDVLALIAVAIGALGIVNTLSVGVSERVREIAILRSHGMTVGQVQAMVVTEAAIMGTIGGVLAVATGLAVALALVGSGSARDFGVGLELPWGLLIAVVLVGTGVAALAGLYPARVAAGLPIVRHLKQFE